MSRLFNPLESDRVKFVTIMLSNRIKIDELSDEDFSVLYASKISLEESVDKLVDKDAVNRINDMIEEEAVNRLKASKSKLYVPGGESVGRTVTIKTIRRSYKNGRGNKSTIEWSGFRYSNI